MAKAISRPLLHGGNMFTALTKVQGPEQQPVEPSYFICLSHLSLIVPSSAKIYSCIPSLNTWEVLCEGSPGIARDKAAIRETLHSTPGL